jgi:hypothetical protein
MSFGTKRSLPMSMDPAILGLLLDVPVPMPRLHEHHREPMIVMVLFEMMRVNVHLAALGSPPSINRLSSSPSSSSRELSKAHRLHHLLEAVDRCTWTLRRLMHRILLDPTHACLTGLLWCVLTWTHPTNISKLRRQLANGREHDLPPGGEKTSRPNAPEALVKPFFPTESPGASRNHFPLPTAFASSCKLHSTSRPMASSYLPLFDSTNV